MREKLQTQAAQEERRITTLESVVVDGTVSEMLTMPKKSGVETERHLLNNAAAGAMSSAQS